MTEDEAHERVRLSRTTLERYDRMMDAGQIPTADIHLVDGEVTALTKIAKLHPRMAPDLHRLAVEWTKAQKQMMDH